MRIEEWIGQKVLITTTNWFHAGGDKTYAAIWGTLKSVPEVKTVLGFTPNMRSNANWMYEVGDMIIMGCQVNYIKLCPDRPYDGELESWTTDAEHGCKVFKTPNSIYFTD